MKFIKALVLVSIFGLLGLICLLVQNFVVAYTLFASIFGGVCILVNIVALVGLINEKGVPVYTARAFWMLHVIAAILAFLCWIWQFVVIFVEYDYLLKGEEKLWLYAFTFPGAGFSLACFGTSLRAWIACRTYRFAR